MGSISANKLGGLGLLVGPGFATLVFLVVFMVLGTTGSGDPRNFEATFDKQSSLAHFLGLLPGISLIFFLYGLNALGNDIKKNGQNEALFRLGSMGVFFGILGIVLSTGLNSATQFDGLSGLPTGYQYTINLIGGATQSYTGLIFSIGFTLIALAVSSNRNGVQKILAYIVAVIGLINIVASFINFVDTSTWEATFIITPITYLVVSIWTATLGLDLMKKA
jgi:heme/copper-type cytochrome/quinol oxidase subunit 4